MKVLKPWAYGPFELIVNAERHYRNGEDFDRRVALIGYDNSIEVSITTYLTLKPIQRGQREYTREDTARWLANYHTKINFFEHECVSRGISMDYGKDEMVWYHDLRNNQYHAGGATVPQARELDGIRKVAIHVFSILYEEPDAEALVQERYDELTARNLPQRTELYDRLIDEKFGMVELAGATYYTSEILYAWDPVAYSESGSELASLRTEQLDGQP